MGFGGLAPRSGCRGAGLAKQTVSGHRETVAPPQLAIHGRPSIRTVADQCDLTAVCCFPLQ